MKVFLKSNKTGKVSEFGSQEEADKFIKSVGEGKHKVVKPEEAKTPPEARQATEVKSDKDKK